jgi:hypothetical protein
MTDARNRVALLIALLGTLSAGLLATGCGTSHPPPLGEAALSEAQSFPYYPLYWAGRNFEGYPITAADGRRGYSSSIGDSVYYGDCGEGVKHGLLGGSCELPLQVTTVIYSLHSNSTLGSQHNIVVRGVPATVYDEGRSIELYSGRVAIDIFSDEAARALRGARALRPLNAPGSASGPLPPPVYCPGLSGPLSSEVQSVMNSLPRRACQHAAAALALARRLQLKTPSH